MTELSVTLPLYCLQCGRPVTVEYHPAAMLHTASPRAWLCPHAGCLGCNEIGGAREIVATRAGHQLIAP